MSSFVLAWDPRGYWWDRADYGEAIRRTAAGSQVDDRWSLSSRRSGINNGDRGYLFRLRDTRGIVASALLNGTIETDDHWNGLGTKAHYAGLTWEAVLPPELGLPVAKLLADVPDVSWNRLSSGIVVSPTSEDRLDQLWLSHLYSVADDVRAGNWELPVRWGRCPECGTAIRVRADVTCPGCAMRLVD